MSRPSLFLLTIDVAARHAEALGGVLMEYGARAVEERTFGRRAELQVYAESRRDLAGLVARAEREIDGFGVASDAIRIESARALDWQSSIVAAARPVRLTPHLRVEPLEAASSELDDDVIALRPGLAFGDGTHPTTQLAARAIEKFCAERRGSHVLDIGAGSGVLSFVAAKSGAARVTAIEVDPAALALARKNARANRLTAKVVFRSRLPTGSPVFDLVVANLEPRVLVAESSRIASAARNAKCLFITGFLSSQAGMVSAGFERAGYAIVGRTRSRGWLLLALTARRSGGVARSR